MIRTIKNIQNNLNHQHITQIKKYDKNIVHNVGIHNGFQSFIF